MKHGLAVAVLGFGLVGLLAWAAAGPSSSGSSAGPIPDQFLDPNMTPTERREAGQAYQAALGSRSPLWAADYAARLAAAGHPVCSAFFSTLAAELS